MPEAKLFTQAVAADGSTVAVETVDHRADRGAWPIRFHVPREQADRWLQHVGAECNARGWGNTSSSEMATAENSGTVIVRAGPTVPCPELLIVWRRRRNGGMGVRCRPDGMPPLSLEEARLFVQRVNERSQAPPQSFYRRGLLYYEGLPWLGEMWLDDTLRLGPPSRQYDAALCGPRVIVVDAVVNGVYALDATFAFDLQLRELAVFLSVIMRKRVNVAEPNRYEWTCEITPDGKWECEPRQIGYVETKPSEMPARGSAPAILLKAVQRPDFSMPAMNNDGWEQQGLPADVESLWSGFTHLSAQGRQQFLRAGSPYRRSLSPGFDGQTLSYSLLIVACEALKPPGRMYDGHNAYGVVQALLGEQVVEQLLRDQSLGVRNAHLHRGEFRGREFLPRLFMPSYFDPSFEQAHRTLRIIAPAAIIEWLRCGGVYALPERPFSPHGANPWYLRVAGAVLLVILGALIGWCARG